MSRRIVSYVGEDTYDMLSRAARIEGVRLSRYVIEGAILRAGFSFSHGLLRDELAAHKARIAAIEQQLGIQPPRPPA